MKNLDLEEIREDESGDTEIIKVGKDGEKEIVTTKKSKNEIIMDSLEDNPTSFPDYESKFSKEEQNRVED